ncbi:metallophosphoesterase family protein [Phenylobacterium montanum]|uniref:metallophosphoesterase family protein n=1 Tax=Phenylobacterium montanum TaxID=2823693 RepID=UPI0020139416|nr:metallophosphoesterase family protein [Caulobacter sp. S6]
MQSPPPVRGAPTSQKGRVSVIARNAETRPDTDGQLIYVVGDVHGRFDLMLALLGKIVADSRERALGRRPIVIFCGDYVDRGPDSAKVMEAVIQLRRRTDIDVRLLKGNHEQAMLDFLREPVEAAGWLRFGGAETLASYGVALEGGLMAESLISARDQLLENMPAPHLHLLHTLELMLVVGAYAVVHAGVRPGVALEHQAEQDLLWIRDPFLDHDGAFDKIIVHGHTWAGPRPNREPHRIGVDTGAYQTGVLTAVRLDGPDVVFLQAELTQDD